MPNHKSPAANGNTVPTYLPLPEAAKKYNIPENRLTRMIQDGRIEGAQLPSGELLVSDDDLSQAKTKEQIIEERFTHLQGQPITISDAASKYKLEGRTIRFWVDQGYVHIIETTYPVKVNEAEVAYCAEVHHNRKNSGSRSGAPLLDENGLPYQLKRPDLSKYRREKRQVVKKQ